MYHLTDDPEHCPQCLATSFLLPSHVPELANWANKAVSQSKTITDMAYNNGWRGPHVFVLFNCLWECEVTFNWRFILPKHIYKKLIQTDIQPRAWSSPHIRDTFKDSTAPFIVDFIRTKNTS
jgi:hypothetical protein